MIRCRWTAAPGGAWPSMLASVWGGQRGDDSAPKLLVSLLCAEFLDPPKASMRGPI